MADKVIGIKIILDGDQQISDLDKELIKVNKELKLMQAQQKALNKDIEAVDKSSQAYDDLLKTQIDLQRKLKESKAAQTELNKTFEYTKVAVGSYNELQGELRQLTKEFKSLSEAERNADVGKNTVDRINELKTQLKELDKGIGDNFRNVGNYTESINSSLSSFKSGFSDVFSGFNVAAAGAFAANAAFDFIKGSVSAFNEAENAAAKLENVIVNIGGESSAALDRLLDQADELELKTFGFTAEQIQATQAQLSLLGLTADEVEKLTPLVLDYATATNKDLDAATKNVTNSLLGKDKALKEVGESLNKDKVTVEEVTDAFTKFEGSASRALDVGTNKTEVLTDTLGKLQESLGAYLTEVLMFYTELYLKFDQITMRLTSGANNQSKIIKGTVDFFSGKTFRNWLSGATDDLNEFTKSAEEKQRDLENKRDAYENERDSRSEKPIVIPKMKPIDSKGLAASEIKTVKEAKEISTPEIIKLTKKQEEEIQEAALREKILSVGEVQQIEQVAEQEKLKRIETNLNLEINAIEAGAQKILAAQLKVNADNARLIEEQLAQIEGAKTELQSQAFDAALLLTETYENNRLSLVQQKYDREQMMLKSYLDNKQITQEQYDKEKTASQERQAKEEIKIRKQLAAVTKTITIAEIAINLAKELSLINSNAAVTTDFTQSLRIFLTAAAIGRAALQTGAVLSQKFAKGGLVEGNSHERGGVQGYIGNRSIELEGGEAVINKRSTEMFKPLLSKINAAGGGKRFAAGGVIPYAYQSGQNGMNDSAEIIKLIAAVNGRIDRLQVIQSVTGLTDIQNEQKRVFQNSVI
jgi:hypothetical protein